MAQSFWKFVKGILLKAETSDPSDNLNGSLWHNSTSNRLKGYFESAVRVFVTENQTQTLLNKSIDADNNTITNIDNNEIKAAAAIDLTKLAAVTANRALQSDGSGFVSASSVTNTELGYVSGVTSSIQSQLDGKEPTITVLGETRGGTGESTYTTGDILYASGSNNLSKLAIGTNTYVLTSNGSVPSWQPASGGGSSFTVDEINANQTLADLTIYLVDTSGGSLTLTLPNITLGMIIEVIDQTGDAATNPITIDTADAALINGQATWTMSTNREALRFVAGSSNWSLA